MGTFCVFVPEELILAAGGVCVGLCSGSQGSIPDEEKTLPRNICPMVKFAYGFKEGKICPYFQSVVFVYGETTCDAKKKTWELLDRMVPTYVMEIQQLKREPDRALWLEEVKDFKKQMEQKSGKTITADAVTKATKVMNAKRKALQRLNALRANNPAPISGKDVLLIEQIAFYDEPVRFTAKVNALCDELDERVKQGNGVAPKTVPRILVSGTPMALPNWKLHNLIESAGGVVVNEESCIGTRYFKDLMDESNGSLDKQMRPRCCGHGGNALPLSMELADASTEEIMAAAGKASIVTYCMACKDRFLSKGSRAYHILEMIVSAIPVKRPISSVRKWFNRFILMLRKRLAAWNR